MCDFQTVHKTGALHDFAPDRRSCVVEGREAVQQAHVVLSGGCHGSGIHPIGREQAYPFVPDLLALTHGHPDVGRHELRTRQGLGGSVSDENARSGFVRALACNFLHFIGWPQRLGCTDAHIRTHDGSHDQQ